MRLPHGHVVNVLYLGLFVGIGERSVRHHGIGLGFSGFVDFLDLCFLVFTQVQSSKVTFAGFVRAVSLL